MTEALSSANIDCLYTLFYQNMRVFLVACLLVCSAVINQIILFSFMSSLTKIAPCLSPAYP